MKPESSGKSILARIPRMPFFLFALLGLVLSMIVHIFSLLGLPSPLKGSTWLLHGGMIAVWIPAVLISVDKTKDYHQIEWWNVVVRGCPLWMSILACFFYGYAILSFFAHTYLEFFATSKGFAEEMNLPIEYTIFSGHWMAIYCTAAALLYPARHADDDSTGH